MKKNGTHVIGVGKKSKKIFGFMQRILKRYKVPEYMQMISSEKYGYICNQEPVLDELPEVVSAEIIRGYNKKNETIHLCGKCRKAFEQFMKMENL